MTDRPPGGASEGARTHLDLLAIADVVRRAAVHDGVDAVHDELGRLRNALVEHVHAEAPAQDALPDATRQLVRQGQERLLHHLTGLLFEAADEGAGCTCLVRVAEVRGLLVRQARLEAELDRLPRRDLRPGRDGPGAPGGDR